MMGDTTTTIKPTPRDTFEKLELRDVTFSFLYKADGRLHLSNSKTFEEVALPAKLLAASQLGDILEGGAEVRVRMSEDGRPLMIIGSPNYICTVASVVPGKEDGGAPSAYGGKGLMQRAMLTAHARGPGTDDKQCTAVVEGGARIACHGAVEAGGKIVVKVEDMSFHGKL